MESRTPQPPGVNSFDAKLAHKTAGETASSGREIPDELAGQLDGDKRNRELRRVAQQLAQASAEEIAPPAPLPFPSAIPDLESERLCRRVDGYLQGWFLNNIPCVLAAELKRRFAKRTGYSWRHIDAIFVVFQKWSSNWHFKRQRLGRSTCIVIRPRRRSRVLTTAEVRRRLAGAIRNYVAQAGRVHVDRKFLERFHARHGLPPEQIFHAWRTLYRIEGMICRWIGCGTGANLFVQTPAAAAQKTKIRQLGGRYRGQNSHPENAGGISPTTWGKNKKTGGARPADPEKDSGSLRSRPGDAENDRPRVCDPPGTDRTRPPSGAPPPGGACKPASKTADPHRWKPDAPPFLVGNRWVTPKKLRAKANFLAFVVFQNSHIEFYRVRFRAAHAVNFALHALRRGFLDREICAAYRAGLKICHASAVRDRMTDICAEGIREPSQAVARARDILDEDNRTDDQRWAAMFGGEARPQGDFGEVAKGAPPRRRPSPKPASPAARPPVMTDVKFPDGSSLEVEGKLPDTTPAVKKAVAAAAPDQLRTIEAFLKTRAMDLPALLRLARAEQQRFIREFHAWQQAPRNSGKE